MKALILAARYPWPPLRGDQMRARDFAVGLESLGASVEVLCAEASAGLLEDHAKLLEGEQPVRPVHPEGTVRTEVLPATLRDRVSGGLAWLGGAPLQAAPFRSRAVARAAVGRLHAMGGEDIVVLQLARQLGLLEKVVRTLAERPPDQRPRIVVDLIDTLSLNFEQRALLDAPWLRGFWRTEAARLRRAERRAVTLADAVSLVCQRDLDALVRFAPEAESKALVVPLPVELLGAQGGSAEDRAEDNADDDADNGAENSAEGGAEGGAEEVCTDLDSSQKAKQSTQIVALTGNLGYFVNHRAAVWFVGKVWPLIHSRRPGASLVVAGARPRPALRQLVQGVGGRLLADPPDLRAVLREATVAVAPLAGGAGVPVKILEGWAEGVPMVVSAWAAQGVAAPNASPDGVEEALVRVCDRADPGLWAQSVVGLLLDAPQRRRLRREGLRRIDTLHGRGAFTRGLEDLLALAAQQRSSAGDEPV